MTTSVELDLELEAAIDALIGTGRYSSRVEILHQGVRLLQEREAKLAAFHTAIDEGLADLEAGRTVSMEEAFAEMDAELDLLLARPAGFAEE